MYKEMFDKITQLYIFRSGRTHSDFKRVRFSSGKYFMKVSKSFDDFGLVTIFVKNLHLILFSHRFFMSNVL